MLAYDKHGQLKRNKDQTAVSTLVSVIYPCAILKPAIYINSLVTGM
jgi:hypothetical protein